MPPSRATGAGPGYAEAERLWQADRATEAEAILRELVARDPHREDAPLLLATIERDSGRFGAAASTLFDACRRQGFPVDFTLRAAQFLQRCQRPGLAADACEAALAGGAGGPELHAVAGNMRLECGAFAAARTHYLAALDGGIDLERWFVLAALARTQRYDDAEHPDFARFRGHVESDGASPRARAATLFGLAKASDDVGDVVAAVAALRKGNALVRGIVPWSPSVWDQSVRARQQERPSALPASDGFAPVFVVGLPRSGTTLTASLLARRTGARDRGELRTFGYVANTLIAGRHLADSGALSEGARLYRAHAVQDDAPAVAYIDQDPLNFRWLHLVTAMFPGARIVHCMRARRDVVLSLWSQDFAHPDEAFAFDFPSIVGFAAGHDRLLRHWHRTLRTPIETVHYESLVADPDGVIGELARRLGLPESPASQAPDAPIESASLWQARQPVYTTSVGRWRRYLPFVPELAAGFDDPPARA